MASLQCFAYGLGQCGRCSHTDKDVTKSKACQRPDKIGSVPHEHYLASRSLVPSACLCRAHALNQWEQQQFRPDQVVTGALLENWTGVRPPWSCVFAVKSSPFGSSKETSRELSEPSLWWVNVSPGYPWVNPHPLLGEGHLGFGYPWVADFSLLWVTVHVLVHLS